MSEKFTINELVADLRRSENKTAPVKGRPICPCPANRKYCHPGRCQIAEADISQSSDEYGQVVKFLCHRWNYLNARDRLILDSAAESNH